MSVAMEMLQQQAQRRLFQMTPVGFFCVTERHYRSMVLHSAQLKFTMKTMALLEPPWSVTGRYCRAPNVTTYS